MLYHLYELSHAAVRPARAAAETYKSLLTNPFNPLSHSQFGQHAAAACEVFERTTRRYEKPEFGLKTTQINAQTVAVEERVVWRKPFCRLVEFKRHAPQDQIEKDPNVLLVAPMSGHYATLLRGTVETLLPDHNVFITDWSDARAVPASEGRFDLDDYIDYVIEMLSHLNGDVHVIAVCQPSVPVLAAISLMEAENHPDVPWSMTLIGGPIDTRINPTAVNKVAETRSLDWFRNNVVSDVPWPFPGAGRSVYPGFMQLSGFMTMNLDRHARAHHDFFNHLVEGDGDSAEKHRVFYDEYLAVMDLTAEFYLQTIDTVFKRHALAEGKMIHRGKPVDTGAVERVALMTIEGEKDDITGIGQCRTALDLCGQLPTGAKHDFEAAGVGHYGLFNGSRFRKDIAPRIAQFMRCHDPKWDNSACALLRKFKPSRSTAARASGVATDGLSQNPDNDSQPAQAKGHAFACGLAQTPDAREIDQASPLQTAIKLWDISHHTWTQSAWRFALALSAHAPRRAQPVVRENAKSKDDEL